MTRGGTHETDLLVANGAGSIVRIERNTRCACCGDTVTAGYMLARSQKQGQFCGDCVARSWLKALPQEAKDWSPEHVCALLNGDASERIRGICACIAYSEGSSGRSSSRWVEILPLGRSVEIFRGLLECAGFPGDAWADGMVRLLSTNRILKTLRRRLTLESLVSISPEDPPAVIKGTVAMVVFVRLDVGEKLKWLHAFRDHPAPDVVSAVEGALEALGVDGFEEAQEILDYQPQIQALLSSYKADGLRSLVGTIRRISGIEIPGTNKTAMATGLIRAVGAPAGMRVFYDECTPPQKRVMNYMAWRKGSVSPEQIEAATGISVVAKTDVPHYSRLYLEREFDDLLVRERRHYDSEILVVIHPWLRQRIKSILPVPEKARLRGTEDAPDTPGSRLFVTEPALAGLFPAFDAMCQQGVISRKKNGDPTAPALRSLLATGQDIEEFYPGDRHLKHRRLEMLVRLADNAAASDVPRTEPADVLRAWLDALTQATKAQAKPSGSSLRSRPAFHLLRFVDHLKGVDSRETSCDAADQCLESLSKAIGSVPRGQWVTVSDLRDFMLYNDLDLPMPRGCADAYVLVLSKWGERERQYVSTDCESAWEEPLLRTFLVILVAVGAADAVIEPPHDQQDPSSNAGYLQTTDALKAVRLTPLGEWYFQGGPEACFGNQARGEVILDDRRLLIRLTGSNPVLQIALDQVAQSLGGGFYRIDGGGLLRDCDSKDRVTRKVEALKSLLPDSLPQVWSEFFENLLLRINPLTPADFVVLEVGDSPEFRRLLLTDPAVRKLCIMAEGGRILLSSRNRSEFKRRLKEQGYFIDSF